MIQDSDRGWAWSRALLGKFSLITLNDDDIIVIILVINVIMKTTLFKLIDMLFLLLNNSTL